VLRLSKLTDYGIVLLAQLAREDPGAPRNARELAEQADLPAPVVSKVLKLLSREGLLESQRGAKGGYTLARPAHRISVSAVIDALEGPVAITDCARGPSVCSHEGTCAVRDPVHVINGVVRDALGTVSLADLIDPAFAAPGETSAALQILGRTPASPDAHPPASEDARPE
jgi:FeS assembly SUF system regulator